MLKRSARECSAKAVEKLECSAEAVEKLECSAEAVEKLECRVKATVEGNLECFALGACCWRCPEATPYLNGSTKCLALPRCSTMRRCAAAFLGFLSKVVGFRFCLLLGVCFGATVVRWSGGFRKLVFGSRRKRACKRWVRVTLKGRIVRHSLPVKGKHSWRPMMRVLCLVRKVLEKFTAPRVRCKAEAQWTPEAERVVHRSRMLAGLPVEISVGSEDELLPDPEQKPKPLNPEDPDPRPSPSGLSPPEDLEVPVYITSERLRAHRNKGHQPYLSFCDTCQSARGRVPARRRNMKSHYAPGELQVDFGFFGRNVRFLLMVHVLSGYLSTVVLGPEDPVPVPAICKALSEMGLNGLDIVVHGDQENLLESVFRDSAKHRTFVGRSMHWVPFAVNRPQAKGIVERNICLVKEAFWSVWLGLEERVGGQLPLGSHLFVEAMRYSVRIHNLFHVSKEQSTPLERLRGSTVQAVKSCEFGVVGFGKPQKDYPEHRGKRLVRAIYVGPQGANGSGIRVFVPLGDGKPPRLEIFSSFRARDPVEFDKAVLDQLKGNREDPERPIKFDMPLDAPQPPPDPPALPDGSLEFPVRQSEEPGAPDAMEDDDLADYSPSLPDDDGMDVEPPGGGVLDGDDDVPMDVGEDTATEEGLTWLYEYGLRQLFDGPDLRVVNKLKPGDDPKEWFRMKFGGKKIWVHVPDNAVCEVSGKVLARKHLEEGMRLELSELDAFGVASVLGEAEARKKAVRRIHTTRWVLTEKPSVSNPDRVRARLVVRDYALGSSPLAEGIYSPTTSSEALRGVLAIHAVRGGTLLAADVSVAFMQAPVQGVEVIRFPSGMINEEGKTALRPVA